MKRFYVMMKKHFWAVPFLPFIIAHELSHFAFLNISGIKGEFFIGISSLGFRGEYELKNSFQAIMFFIAAIAPLFIFIPYVLWLNAIVKEINLLLALYLAAGVAFIIPSTADFKMALLALKYLFKK